MSIVSNCTIRRKRGISLSSRNVNQETSKGFKEHHTTVQSSFIRQQRPSSVSCVYQKPPSIISHLVSSSPKFIPKKITFKYTNKQTQPPTPKLVWPIEFIQPRQQIRYLIGPGSSRIKVQNEQQVVNKSSKISLNLNIAQSNYVSPYKNLITPLKVQTHNTNNQSKQFLPLNSELSKIKEFKMEEDFCLENQVKQIIQHNKILKIEQTQKNIEQLQGDDTTCVLKQRTFNKDNICSQQDNIYSSQTNAAQKNGYKKAQKTRGRMNHLRIKEVQKRLQEIIKVCDSNLC